MITRDVGHGDWPVDTVHLGYISLSSSPGLTGPVALFLESFLQRSPQRDDSC